MGNSDNDGNAELRRQLLRDAKSLGRVFALFYFRPSNLGQEFNNELLKAFEAGVSEVSNSVGRSISMRVALDVSDGRNFRKVTVFSEGDGADLQ